MFDRFDGLLAQKHMVPQGHDITHHSPTITRPSYNLGGKQQIVHNFMQVEVHTLH